MYLYWTINNRRQASVKTFNLIRQNKLNLTLDAFYHITIPISLTMDDAFVIFIRVN